MNTYDFSQNKRIVIKVGSNSLMHPETGKVNYGKLEKLVRQICNLRNSGIDVCLVSSGAIAVGRQCMSVKNRPKKMSKKQALASVGQARLMAIYQRLFAEYNQYVGQVLMTKETMIDNVSRKNAQNTFEELFSMGVVPIVNENDTISTYEIQFGDNDTLSAIVASLVGADLLILLSDIDGLYTADPKTDPDAKLIEYVPHFDEKLLSMATNAPGSDVGTGGMTTKLHAARIATASGTDMMIVNGEDVSILSDIMEGEFRGTLFASDFDDNFDVLDILEG